MHRVGSVRGVTYDRRQPPGHSGHAGRSVSFPHPPACPIRRLADARVVREREAGRPRRAARITHFGRIVEAAAMEPTPSGIPTRTTTHPRPTAARLVPALLRRRAARHGLHPPAVTGADLRLVIAQVAGRHRRRCRRPRPASMNPSMPRRFGQIGSLDLVDLLRYDRASSTGRPSLTDSTPSPAPASSTRPGRSPASVRRAPRTGGSSLNYLTRAPASRRPLGRRRAA